MSSPHSLQPALKLERAIGLTSLSNSSFCSSPTSGDVFYASGCFVVKYNPEENKQKGFYKSSKAISSISISQDGKFLAVGERGQSPCVTVWSVDTFEVIATLSAHKHGVGCMAFSPDGRYLVTVGFKLDRQLILWDWKTSYKVSTQKLGNKVHSVGFHCSGEFFVTAGDRHLKWWTIMEVIEGESVSLEGKAASILEDMRNSVFMDVVCGSGTCSSSIYCTTSTGVLCLFNEQKMVEKWVQLESASSFCLELFSPEGAPGLLIVGCANGIIRCFDPQSLQYIATLPLPAPLLGAVPPASADREENADTTVASEPTEVALDTHSMYAACYGVCKVVSSHNPSAAPKLATIYADRSLFVWDISDMYAIAKYRSFQYHRACVWDIQFIEDTTVGAAADSAAQAGLPKGTFVTCSADNTLRFWNTDQRLQRQSKYRSLYSREMLHAIDLLEDVPPEAHAAHANASFATNLSHASGSALNASISVTHYFAQQNHSTADLDVCEGVPDLELPDRPQSKYAPRALAVHPRGHELACGDKMGTLMIFDIRGMQQVSATPAHAAEILTLSYSPPMTRDEETGAWGRKETDFQEGDEELVLLASAGRDRLIHVFNASEKYSPIQTLDNHSSSVTIARFTSDGRRFLSCGGDRSMVFSSVEGPAVTRLKSVQTPHGTINGLAVEASNKFAVTSGQDKRLNIWNLHTGKHMRAYRNEHIHSELYKSDIDPSGTYIATCSFDKTISIFDFFSGELVTQVTGHSELVTGVKFSPDGRHLVTIGGDGCIFMWRVADYLVKAMQERLVELLSNAQRRKVKATAAVRKSLDHGAPGSHLDNPPPLPAPSFGPPTAPSTAEVAAASSKHTTQQQQPQQSAPTSTGSALNTSTSSTTTGGVSKSRWAERVEQDGYELFGKKIDPTAAPNRNRNKFTLELSETTRVTLPTASPGGQLAPSADHIPSEESAVTAVNLTASGRQVDALEAQDDVMCSALSDEDDEGDGSELFKPVSSGDAADTEDEYESDFETPTGDNAAKLSKAPPDLNHTQEVIEGLEKTAKVLDNWLEDMLRSEGRLDEGISVDVNAPGLLATPAPVPSAEPSSATTDAAVNSANDSNSSKTVRNRRVINNETGQVSVRAVVAVRTGSGLSSSKEEAFDALDQSLSSAFFQNLRGDHPAVPGKEVNAILPPPPPTAADEAVARPTDAQVRERKQRDAAAAVAQMRERLKGMGIIPGTQKIVPEGSSEPSPITAEPGHRQPVDLPTHSPVQKPLSAPIAAAAEDGYDTASTASEPEVAQDALDESTQIANNIAQKTRKYRNILRELEAAKKKAADSFRELSDLRQSLDQSMRESTSALKSKQPTQKQQSMQSQHQRVPSTASIPENDVLNVSMAQVDELMLQFQDSFAGLGSTAAAGVNASSRRSGASSSLGFSQSSEALFGESAENMNGFLERYSDKLADMVGEKIMTRMNSSK